MLTVREAMLGMLLTSYSRIKNLMQYVEVQYKAVEVHGDGLEMRTVRVGREV